VSGHGHKGEKSEDIARNNQASDQTRTRKHGGGTKEKLYKGTQKGTI
jgi:hypothetical protein